MLSKHLVFIFSIFYLISSRALTNAGFEHLMSLDRNSEVNKELPDVKLCQIFAVDRSSLTKYPGLCKTWYFTPPPSMEVANLDKLEAGLARLPPSDILTKAPDSKTDGEVSYFQDLRIPQDMLPW